MSDDDLRAALAQAQAEATELRDALQRVLRLVSPLPSGGRYALLGVLQAIRDVASVTLSTLAAARGEP